MIRRILNRLQLSSAVYDIISRFQRRQNVGMSVNEAMEFLDSCMKNPCNSCICEHHYSNPDCDLEIIVPCYNVEHYVEDCLASILSQKTAYSFCVTVINDGSTDHTGNLLQKYEHLENVNVITQRNRGLSGARNTGIEQAHGRYLMFVDSDDLLLPDAIESMMGLATTSGADIVDSGHIRFADRKVKGLENRIKADLYDFMQHPQKLEYNEHSPGITGYPWGKVLNRELFHRVKFPEGYWFEDTLVWMILEPMCKNKATTDALTFRYRMNPNSISHTSDGKMKSLDTLYVTLQLLADREMLGIRFDQRQYEMLLRQMRNNHCRVLGLPEDVRRAVFVVQSDLIKRRFSMWNTSDSGVKPIQDILRNADFADFELWCKWH